MLQRAILLFATLGKVDSRSLRLHVVALLLSSVRG